MRHLTIFILLLLAAYVKATMIVYDPALHAQTLTDELRNLAQFTQTATKQTETALSTLRTYENTVLQVTRMGNPAALRSLPVVGSIAELVGSGQQLLREYDQIKGLTDVRYLQGQLPNVQNAYGLQQWNPLSPGAYQFPTASYAVSQSVQDQMKNLELQRQNLQRQRDQTLSALANASDQSSVQKYTGALAGVNGAIAEIGAREQALSVQSQLAQQQLSAGSAVQRQQVTEQSAVGVGKDVNNSLQTLETLSQGYGSMPHWGQR